MAQEKLMKIVEKERVKEEKTRLEALAPPKPPVDPLAPPPPRKKGPGTY